MATSSEWFVDNVPLKSGIVRDVENRAGWRNVAAPTGQNLNVPNRAGEIYVPKSVAAGGLILNLWLHHRSEEELNNGWEALLRTVVQPHRMVTIHEYRPGGAEHGQRVCRAELVGGIRPTPSGRNGMRASLNFRIPAGIWETVYDYPFESEVGPSLPKVVGLSDLAQSTAPIDNAILTIVGPITNPVVSWHNPAYGMGSSVKYTGTVPDGAKLILNSGTWGITGVGFTPNKAAVIPTGSRFMTIEPSDAPSLTLSGIGGGAKTQLLVSAHAAFLA